MSNEELDKLAAQFHVVKSMTFIQFIEAINAGRLHVNTHGFGEHVTVDEIERMMKVG